MRFRILLLALALAPRASAQEEPRPKPPNVLFVLADDLGWRDLGCYGNERIATPNLDALCEQGMRFTDAYAAAPVCSPSRAAILTGRSPARLGITNHVPESPTYAPPDAPIVAATMRQALPLEELTFAEAMKARGYSTCFLGKWHLSGPYSFADGGRGDPRFGPEHQGFDRNVGGCAFGGPPSYFDPYGIYNIPMRAPGEYLPERMAGEAVRFLRESKERKKPFLLCLWTYEVHWPLEAPPERVKPYLEKVGPGLLDPVYGAMVSSLDSEVGRVLRELDALGLANDTLVIFMSDNGGWDEASDNRPLRGSKGFLFEGGIRVPLLVRWPGVVEPGSTCHVPVIGTDLFPTLVEAAGVELPGDLELDGRSLVPLLRGEPFEARPLYFHYPHYAWHGMNRPGGAIRDGKDKLILRYDDDSLELYDLERDLDETTNRAEEEPERAAELAQRLRAWLEATGARMPRHREPGR